MRRPTCKDLQIQSNLLELYPNLTIATSLGAPAPPGPEQSWLDDESSDEEEYLDDITNEFRGTYYDDSDAYTEFELEPQYGLNEGRPRIYRYPSSETLPSVFEWDDDDDSAPSSPVSSPCTPKSLSHTEIHSDSGIGDCESAEESTDPPSFLELEQYDQEAYLEVSRILSNMIVDTSFGSPLRADLEKAHDVLRDVADQRSTGVIATADVAHVEKPKPISRRVDSTLDQFQSNYELDNWF
jgi:hypothetical protein